MNVLILGIIVLAGYIVVENTPPEPKTLPLSDIPQEVINESP